MENVLYLQASIGPGYYIVAGKIITSSTT